MYQDFLNAPVGVQILIGLFTAVAVIVVVLGAVITIKNEIKK